MTKLGNDTPRKGSSNEDRERNSQKGVEPYSRKEKSLGLLCQNFVNMYENSTLEEVCLDTASTALNVERRRIYDIVNVLESVGMVVRKAKNRYTWYGKSRMESTLGALKMEAVAHKLGTFKSPEATPEKGANEANRASPYGSADRNSQSAYDSDGEQDEKKGAKKDFSRKEKSLGILSLRFVQLFLTSEEDHIALESAAIVLIEGEKGKEIDSGKLKTKIRRLYDIANILASLGLIEKVQVKNKKPAFRWRGPARVKMSINPSEAPPHSRFAKRERELDPKRAKLKAGPNKRKKADNGDNNESGAASSQSHGSPDQASTAAQPNAIATYAAQPAQQQMAQMWASWNAQAGQGKSGPDANALLQAFYMQQQAQAMQRMYGSPFAPPSFNSADAASNPGRAKAKGEAAAAASAGGGGYSVYGMDPNFDVSDYMERAKQAGEAYYQRAQEWYKQLQQWQSMMGAYRMPGMAAMGQGMAAMGQGMPAMGQGMTAMGQGMEAAMPMGVQAAAMQSFQHGSMNMASVMDMYKAMGYPVDAMRSAPGQVTSQAPNDVGASSAEKSAETAAQGEQAKSENGRSGDEHSNCEKSAEPKTDLKPGEHVEEPDTGTKESQPLNQDAAEVPRNPADAGADSIGESATLNPATEEVKESEEGVGDTTASAGDGQDSGRVKEERGSSHVDGVGQATPEASEGQHASPDEKGSDRAKGDGPNHRPNSGSPETGVSHETVTVEKTSSRDEEDGDVVTPVKTAEPAPDAQAEAAVCAEKARGIDSEVHKATDRKEAGDRLNKQARASQSSAKVTVIAPVKHDKAAPKTFPAVTAEHEQSDAKSRAPVVIAPPDAISALNNLPRVDPEAGSVHRKHDEENERAADIEQEYASDMKSTKDDESVICLSDDELEVAVSMKTGNDLNGQETAVLM